MVYQYSQFVVRRFQQNKVLQYSWIDEEVGFDSFGYNESTDILSTTTEYAHSAYIKGRYSQLMGRGRSLGTHRLVPYAAQPSRAG